MARKDHLGIQAGKGFISFSKDELKAMEYNAFDLENKRGYFRVEHTSNDGKKEICRVESSADQDGYKIWSIGAYTTKKGSVHLAVVGAKVLPGIKIIHHGNKKK
jgi:hypothetical protein